MLGPVYTLEWLQASRRVEKSRWRWIYVGLLFLEMQWLTINVIEFFFSRDPAHVILVAEILVYLIAAQQTVAILFVTPAFAAGSVTDEKRRGTLDFLLVTPLAAGEIVLGKWLGQATRVLHLLSPAYLVLAILAGTVGEPSQPVFISIAEQIVFIYAITALSLLASIWSRTTPKAILTVYVFLAGAMLAEWFFNVPIIGSSLWATPLGVDTTLRQRLAGIGWLMLLTLVCLLLAAWRLRPAHERQQVAKPTIRGRWWDRPAIGEAPLRWKERFSGDWTSVPIWSVLPGWTKYLMLAGLTAAVAFTWPDLATFLALGAVQVVGGGLFVGIRAAGSITSEREKQTWDSLLVTRMDAHQLLRGKLWGHIDAVRPYLLAYLVPALLAAWWADPWYFLGILYAWLAGWIVLYYLGALGITASVAAVSTWRSILTTLLGMVTSLVTSQLLLTYFAIFLWASLIMFMLPASWLPAAAVICAVLGPVPGLLWLLAVAEERLEQAERALVENDRALAKERGEFRLATIIVDQEQALG